MAFFAGGGRWFCRGVVLVAVVLVAGGVSPVGAVDDGLAPSGLSAVSSGDGVVLSWDAPVVDAGSVTGYQVLRRRPLFGEWSLGVHVADTASVVTEFVDTGVQAGVRYVYRVAALRGAQVSATSVKTKIVFEPPPVEPVVVEPPVGVVWSAVLTVGAFEEEASVESLGFWAWSSANELAPTGGLSPRSFTVGDHQVNVSALFTRQDGGLWLGFGGDLPDGFVLDVGGERFASATSNPEPRLQTQSAYRWDATPRQWTAGDTVDVSITIGDEQLGPGAEFTDMPDDHDDHDDTGAVTVGLSFDEAALVVDAARLSGHALKVTGGTVTNVEARSTDNRHWDITLTPDGPDETTVSLEVIGDCNQPAAICSTDGRELRQPAQTDLSPVAAASMVTMELPPGCVLHEIDAAQVSGQWTPECHSVFRWDAYYGDLLGIDYGFARFYRLELPVESDVLIAADSSTSRRIVLRSADGTELIQALRDYDTNVLKHGLVVPLPAGTYVIELIQHFSWDGRQREYTLVVQGEHRLRTASPALSALQLSDTDMAGFDPSTVLYEAHPTSSGVSATTVTATPVSPDAEVHILPDDNDPVAEGHQVALSAGGPTEIRVVVSDPLGSTPDVVYTVVVGLDPAVAPSGLRARMATDGIRLDWSAPSAPQSTVTGYAIMRREVGANSSEPALTTLVADTESTDTSYLDSTAVRSQNDWQWTWQNRNRYSYQVRALYGSVSSGGSNVVDILFGSPVDSGLESLTVDGYDLSPNFSAGVLSYELEVPAHTAAVTVRPGKTSQEVVTTVEPAQERPDVDGHRVELEPVVSGGGPSETTITVTSSDSGPYSDRYFNRYMVWGYRITVIRAAADPGDGSLALLDAVGRELTPAFEGGVFHYEVAVPTHADTVDLKVVPASPTATVTYSPQNVYDGDDTRGGYQIVLDPVPLDGEPAVKTITFVITSEDGVESRTYTITVTRAGLEPGTGPVSEAGFKYVEVGWAHACAIRVDGTLACWGYNDMPSIEGHENIAERQSGYLQSLGVVQEVTASKYRTCALRPDGETRCSGDPPGYVTANSKSIEGDGTMTQQSGAGPLIHRFSPNNGCRLLADGSADCSNFQPPQSLRAGPYKAIATGSFVICALNLEGHIKCWVRGKEEMPWPLPDVEYRRIAGGGHGICGIRAEDNTLDCRAVHDRSWEPYRWWAIPTPSDEFETVDMGYNPRICGLRTDKTVTCWGDYVPASPAPDQFTLGYTMVSFDRFPFACGLRTDTTIACWGDDDTDNEYLVSQLPPMESPWRDSPDLLALETSSGPLAPSFAGDTTEYSLTVPSGTTTLTLAPEVTNLFATYTITADTDTSVVDDTIDLSAGPNVITVTVVAADDATTKIYTVTVNR